MSAFNFTINPMEMLRLENKRKIELIKPLLVKGGKFDKKKLSLGFSGGKDSSVTLMLTLIGMLEIEDKSTLKTLFVLYSDTLMELLPVQAHTYKVLEQIKLFAAKHNLPIKVMHAKPKLEQTMWSLQIAKGFRQPSSDNRYCTSRLKTDVQEEMLALTFGTDDIETISIVGSRKEESADRAKRLTENTIDGHLKGHNEFSKSLVFAPIEEWTTSDVWTSLRSHEIGKTLLLAEELYTLYATTNGEGEECQTVLGNAGESGKNPGCSQSGGRFGCWNCGLQHGKDAALTGMQKTFPYIKYLIRYRNWASSTRDGNWDTYRDEYNHKLFTRFQYNLDNHRFGITCPGGLNLKTRKHSLMRLLWTEMKVNETEKFQLISDEELEFIQHRWLMEGDFELTALKIAKRYGRDIKISVNDRRLLSYAKALYITMPTWEQRVSVWFNIFADKRFCIQFVKQITENQTSFEKMNSILVRIVEEDNATIVADNLMNMQLRKQFYPSPSLKKLIHREWIEDKVSFVTQSLINDYEDSWEIARDEEEIYDDLFEDPNISMEDKYAVLDNWDTFVGSDTNEKFVHEEYMRYGGNYQYVSFRERQSEENRSKNKKFKAVKAANNKSYNSGIQGVFAF